MHMIMINTVAVLKYTPSEMRKPLLRPFIFNSILHCLPNIPEDYRSFCYWH